MSTRKFLPPETVKHQPFCSAPVVTSSTTRYGDTIAKCKDCGASYVLETAEQPKHQTVYRQDPPACDVDLPALAKVCERRGIPLLVVDRTGMPCIVRSVADLDSTPTPDAPLPGGRRTAGERSRRFPYQSTSPEVA